MIGWRLTLESTITADSIPGETRGVGMGVLGTVNGIGDLGASVIVGVVWTAVSPVAAFGYAAIVMLVGAFALLSVRRED